MAIRLGNTNAHSSTVFIERRSKTKTLGTDNC